MFPAPADVRDRLLSEPEVFEVFEENWPAVEIFLRLATQWRLGAMGGVFGLDYTAVEAVLRMLRTDNPREIFDSIQVMEYAALPVLNEKKD